MTTEQSPLQNSQGRRSGDERRGSDDPEAETKQRSGSDRRRQEDRRGLHYSVKFTSQEAVEEMRNWLQASCDGGWTIGIPDMETASTWGNFRVRFESQGAL